MGSPLVPTLSIFYMNHIENDAFNNFSKPSIFTRFIDDIFMPTTSLDEIKKKSLENALRISLSYISQYNIIDRILLLDVLDEARVRILLFSFIKTKKTSKIRVHTDMNTEL